MLGPTRDLGLALLLGLAQAPPSTFGPAMSDGAIGPRRPQPASERALAFDEAIALADQSPSLEGLREATTVKKSHDQSIPRLVYGPQITVMPGARVHPPANRGFELQATIVQPWNLGGYGNKRHETARSEAALLQARTRAEALEQQLAAARVWIELSSTQTRLLLAREQQTIATRQRTLLEDAVAAGVATSTDASIARADEGDAKAMVLALEGEVHELGLLLARETGRSAGEPLTARGDYPAPSLPDDAAIAAAFNAAGDAPMTVVHRLQARVARAQAAESIAANGIQLSTGASIQREGTSDLALFGVVGLTLPGDRGQRQRASSFAAAREHEGRAEQAQLDLDATLAAVAHELVHAREQAHLLDDELVPTHERTVEVQREAVGLGEGTRTELLRAEGRLAAVRQRQAEARGRLAWAEVHTWLYLEALAEDTGPQ